jgi:hypothetical protein
LGVAACDAAPEGFVMPITPYLQGQAFDPELISTMSAVLERVCAQVGLQLVAGKKDPAAEVIAARIIELAQRGIRTEHALYAATIREFKLGDGKPT